MFSQRRQRWDKKRQWQSNRTTKGPSQSPLQFIKSCGGRDLDRHFQDGSSENSITTVLATGQINFCLAVIARQLGCSLVIRLTVRKQVTPLFVVCLFNNDYCIVNVFEYLGCILQSRATLSYLVVQLALMSLAAPSVTRFFMGLVDFIYFHFIFLFFLHFLIMSETGIPLFSLHVIPIQHDE